MDDSIATVRYGVDVYAKRWSARALEILLNFTTARTTIPIEQITVITFFSSSQNPISTGIHTLPIDQNKFILASRAFGTALTTRTKGRTVQTAKFQVQVLAQRTLHVVDGYLFTLIVVVQVESLATNAAIYFWIEVFVRRTCCASALVYEKSQWAYKLTDSINSQVSPLTLTLVVVDCFIYGTRVTVAVRINQLVASTCFFAF